jgi:hypothetical protein
MVFFLLKDELKPSKICVLLLLVNKLCEGKREKKFRSTKSYTRLSHVIRLSLFVYNVIVTNYATTGYLTERPIADVIELITKHGGAFEDKISVNVISHSHSLIFITFSITFIHFSRQGNACDFDRRNGQSVQRLL